jgi:hypothetical protein
MIWAHRSAKLFSMMTFSCRLPVTTRLSLTSTARRSQCRLARTHPATEFD